MTTYLSPGVYVKEVSSGLVPIAGVGTSTAGFIGIIISQVRTDGDPPLNQGGGVTPTPLKSSQEIIGDNSTKSFTFNIAPPFGPDATAYRFYREADRAGYPAISLNPDAGKPSINGDTATVTFPDPIPNNKKLLATYQNPSGEPSLIEVTTKTPLKSSQEITGDGSNKTFTFNIVPPFGPVATAYRFYREADVDGNSPVPLTLDNNRLSITANTATVTFTDAIPTGKKLLATYTPPSQVSRSQRYSLQQVKREVIGKGDGTKTEFTLSRYPVASTATGVVVYKDGTKSEDIRVQSVTNDPQENNSQKPVSTIKFSSPPPANAQISVDYTPQSVAAGDVKLCTNFSEFKKYFGDFSTVEGQSNLAHAVYGFFRNGGTRCFVTWVAGESGIEAALDDFAAIDEIAIVAVPGCTNKAVLKNLSDHCEKLGDRVAIFDAPDNANVTKLNPGESTLPGKTEYAALYYPWIKVFDPPTKDANPKGDGLKVVPPSGHIAGIYARVDTQRGVHKAPANEVIMGATDLQVSLTRAKQDGLNPQGVNCIRNLNGNILVWGARTWGGDGNNVKYINVRRQLNYLQESIDEGTQWAVFEPNSPELWAKVRRSVTAFLTVEWRKGALFGATPQEAFFVQCDEETNPPEVCDAGQLIVKVGVAIVKPAEFVIFELSQMSGGK